MPNNWDRKQRRGTSEDNDGRDDGGRLAEALNTLYNLAYWYKSQRRYAEAEPLFREAVSGARRKLGLAHPQTQIYLRHTADTYELAGQPERAEPLWRELAEVVKQQTGPEAPL